MGLLARLFCRHDYERQVVYIDSDEVVKRCRKCGKQVRERDTGG
jgi:hypothetical protein